MIRFALLGLGVGALYAIGALGVVCIHRGSKVLNLAHGAIATWAAYLYVDLRDDHRVPTVLAAIAAVGCCAVAGALIYLIIIRPLRFKTPLTKMIATLGLLAVLDGTIQLVFNTQDRIVSSSLPTRSVKILGAAVGIDRLFLLAIAVALTALLAFWSASARIPLATRAMAEHERAAVSLGQSPHKLGALNWALGSALAALAGILIVPILGLSPTSISAILVPSLAAALLGKFDSYWLALAGGLATGVAEGLIQHYVTAPGWSYAAPIGLVVIALTLQRRKAINRLERVSAPTVGSASVRLIPLLLGLAAVLVFLFTANSVWLSAAINSLCFAIVGMSLVVLIGFANQISLAQMAIAGLGAFVAARAALGWHLPFVLLPVVGAFAGALAGLIVGLPALRVRGINLAIVTLGVGLAIEHIVFGNPNYTGGYAGISLPSPTVFGLHIDAAAHPRGYALFALAWALVSLAVVILVRRSNFGRQLLSMRTNERAASSLGINVPRVKLCAFVISAALAGMAGVLIGFQNQQLTFFSFTYQNSLNVVIVVVIAGVGSYLGGTLAGIMASGGILFQAFSNVSFVSNHYALITGIGLVWTILIHPDGVALPSRREIRPDPVGIPGGEAEARKPLPLVAENVFVKFGGVLAVNSASIKVNRGEVVGLVGPNGAGKTTLLDALGGFAILANGTVRLGDTDLSSKRTHQRAKSGVARVFQSVELFEDLTVAQNLLLAAQIAGGTSGRLTRVARQAIERFHLSDVLHRRPSSLSMAERKLVGVVRALAANPAVLTLDEPGAGLSMTDSAELGREIAALARAEGLGVLIVDHDMGLVMSCCDRIIVLQQGSVIANGTPSEVRGDVRVRAAYLGESIIDEAIAEVIEDAEQQLSIVEKGSALGVPKGLNP